MKGERPWFSSNSTRDMARLHAPATLRNRDAIANVLATELPERGLVLEVASGSGEHAVHFAACFPALLWQPSDPDPLARSSIAAWADEANLANLNPPMALDALSSAWPMVDPAAILCINMTHISPWEATLGLLDGAARLLEQGAPLILYGPFLRTGAETAPSNLEFDAQLRERKPAFGIRAVEDIDEAARARGLARTALHPMPANNLTLVYRIS